MTKMVLLILLLVLIIFGATASHARFNASQGTVEVFNLYRYNSYILIRSSTPITILPYIQSPHLLVPFLPAV